MKLISLTCPSCNARLKVENDRKFTFCQYCGTQIYLDDEVKRTEYIRRKIDETKIKELEYQERSEIREREEKRKKLLTSFGLMAVGGILMFIGNVLGEASGNPDSSFYILLAIGALPCFGGFWMLMGIILDSV